MNETSIQTERGDGRLTVWLNRPDKLNCLNLAMRQALLEAIEALREDRETRVVVLAARGRAFCSGQDLTERARAADEAPPDLGSELQRGFNRVVSAIRELPVPVVCAVNGDAAGVGMSLALACDVVIAARTASFLPSFGRLGLIPDAGATWTIPRLGGMARARGALLLDAPVSAEQAAQWGWIWAAVEKEALHGEVDRAVAGLLAMPRLALAALKKALAAAGQSSFGGQLELEADLQRALGRSEDYREAVSAFLEKRAPRFRGG